MVENGGAFSVWWEPDGSPSYEVTIRYLDSIFYDTTTTVDTLHLKTLTRKVILNALTAKGEYRGFESDWEPPSPFSNGDIVIYPLNRSDSTRPFGLKFDSLGAPLTIGWSSFPADSSIVFWVDSTRTELIGGGAGPIRQLHRAYLSIAGGTYPESLGIAPPPDTTIYITHALLRDGASYWVWIDNYPVGYTTTDHFALVKVNLSTNIDQAVTVKTSYQRAGGLRWVWF